MLILLISFFYFPLFFFKNWLKIELFLSSWFSSGEKKIDFGTNVETSPEESTSLLDLPELTLECILEKISPAGLCAMAGVCSSLRERCCIDHLWEKHMKQKWSRVVGNSAFSEWQCHVASRKKSSELCLEKKQRLWFMRFLFAGERGGGERRSTLSEDCVMAWFLSLETGGFWFPAQVFNRENGHSGFVLSCYDAKLKYNCKIDTFHARYSAQGRAIEESISWDRVRVAPVYTPSHDLHISDYLPDLKPGDHVEIQWRKSKEYPYGWWYAVVGHLESCDGNESNCRCQFNESRWRNTMINRKNYREVGNEVDGFYGGIRMICNEEEISMWKRFRPKH